MAGQNIDPMWKVLSKDLDLGEPTVFLDHVYLRCAQRECHTSKETLWTITETCLNPKSLLDLQKRYSTLRKLAHKFPHGPMIWNVTPRNPWKDIANWQTKQLDGCTKSQHHAWTTTNSRKKK